MKLTVTDILNAKGKTMHTISPDKTVYEAITEMDEQQVGALLVMEDNQLLGVISERDYARKIVLRGKTSRETRVRDIMTTDLAFAHPEESVHDSMQTVTEKRIRHLPVQNDEGKLVGLISIGDLVNAVIKEQAFNIDQLKNYITQSYPVL